MRRRKYQMTDRLERKVFELKQEGSTLKTFIQMRKAAPARSAVRELETEEAATKEFDRLCAEREGQGWSLVESFDTTRGGGGSGDGSGVASSDDKEGARLLASIVSAPDDLDQYQVYSDWLTERDDPLGELIAVGLELEKDPKNKKLKGRESQIVVSNAPQFLGELNGAEGWDVTYRRGFLDSVEIGVDEPCSLIAAEVIPIVFRLRTACVLRKLVLGDFGSYSDLRDGVGGTYQSVFDELKRVTVPVTLRHLETAPKVVRLRDAEVGNVESLYERLPNLEVLVLMGVAIEVGDLARLSRLRKLEIKTISPSRSLMESIGRAASKLKALESLDIDFGGRAGEVLPQSIANILNTLPSTCKTVAFRSITLADDVMLTFLSSPSAARVKALTLTGGGLTNVGARALLAQMEALGHMTRIDLSEQLFSADVIEELRAAFGDRITVDDADTPRREVNDEDYNEDDYYEEITE